MSEPLTGPAAMLADALTRLGVAEHKHGELAGVVSELGGELIGLGERQDRVETAVNTLIERIEEHFGGDEEDDDKADLRQVNWVTLDRGQAVEEWDRLYTWIEDVLISQYLLTRAQLPDCWTHHPDIRNHLSWLRVSWVQGVQPNAAAGLLADWHLRQYEGALAAILAIKNRNKCGGGKHLGEKLAEDQMMPDENVVTSPDSWIPDGREQDIEARPEPPAPPEPPGS